MKDTKVASVQFEHAPGDKQANLDKVRRFTAEAAEQEQGPAPSSASSLPLRTVFLLS